MRGAVLLPALRQIGCTGEEAPAMLLDPARAQGQEDGPAPPIPAAEPETAQAQPAGTAEYSAFECGEVPTAYVFELEAAGLTLPTALAASGFVVEALPLDRSPIDLRGLIVIPAAASERPEYAQYMDQYADALSSFVDAANVLVQLPQDPERESSPAFVPVAYGLSRKLADVGTVHVRNADHLLMQSVPIGDDGSVAWSEPEGAATVFEDAEGFEVVIADAADQPLLVETAYGQGRFVLCALSLDRAERTDAEVAVATTILGNLFAYVQAVCMRKAGVVRLSPSQSKTAFTEGSSMLAVLPDTQFYSLRYPGLYLAQTGWIRNHASERDIRYAIHLGDIVHNNTRQEWDRASQAMGQLHGVVPYALAPGNHDYGPAGDASTRETHLNEYFAFRQSADMPTFGGAFESGKLDNSYHMVSLQGRDLIVMALEWGPRNEVIAWADEVMQAHPDRQGVLVTHAYLNHNDRRYDHTDRARSQRFNPHDYATPGGVNDGEELWQKLVRRHRFILTLNGHVLGDGCGYLVSTTDRGNTCHQMLSNYQMRAQGGEGYMRLLEFLGDGRTVRVFTYSPLYDNFLDVEGHNFEFTLD